MRPKPYWTVIFVLLLCASASFAQTKKATGKAAGPGPDKALLQKIWDGWATLDPANVAQFYATGPHTFFDIAPLKYGSWEEYQKGVVNVLADFKTAKLTVNDDAVIHPAGEFYWGTATVKEDVTMKSGKREMATFRWTFVFAKQDGKWVLVHEHISEPLS
jgi:ketosteroid isomerase-like protein